MADPWDLTWQDYYELLGVTPAAPPAQVHVAFRTRARELHPDRYVGAAEPLVREYERQFKLLSEAYEVLRDPAQRARYDAARTDLSAIREVRLTPASVRTWGFSSRFAVKSRVTYVAQRQLDEVEVECADPAAELRSVELRHTGAGKARVKVRGVLLSGGSRELSFRYSIASQDVVQQVHARLPLARALRLIRPPAPMRARTRVLLGIAGLFTFGGLALVFTSNDFAVSAAAISGIVLLPGLVSRLWYRLLRVFPQNRTLGRLVVFVFFVAAVTLLQFLGSR